MYDYKVGNKTNMPSFVLDVFQDTWRQQEDITFSSRTRIWRLIKEVEALEKNTWDCKDAVEDLGATDKRSL